MRAKRRKRFDQVWDANLDEKLALLKGFGTELIDRFRNDNRGETTTTLKTGVRNRNEL